MSSESSFLLTIILLLLAIGWGAWMTSKPTTQKIHLVIPKKHWQEKDNAVIGNKGGISIYRWQAGDDVRLQVYDDDGCSVYLPTNQYGIKELLKGIEKVFSLKPNESILLQEAKAMIKLYAQEDKLHVQAQYIFYPKPVIAIFNQDQIKEIVNRLNLTILY